MRSSMVEILDLQVKNRNYERNQQDSHSDKQISPFNPSIKNELITFNHHHTPLSIELFLNKAKLSIYSDCIEGYLRFKDTTS